MTLLGILAGIAVLLTCAMFATRNIMLGFPSAIFWALAGGWSYQQSVATWDIYFLLAFASLLGMTTFCMLGAYGLREKRDTIGEQEMEKGDGKRIGEEEENKSSSWFEDDGVPELDDNLRPKPKSGVTTRQATRATKPRRKGEFGF